MSTEKSHKDSIKQYREYLSEEVDGIYIYTQLAEIEDDPGLSEVYSHLAESEQRHIDLWQKELGKLYADTALPQPSTRARLLMWVARTFGPDIVLPVI